jgi:hypothetical protein
MSKLAHSNDETMAQIERDAADREQRGERDEPQERTPGPWRLHDMERATIVAGRPGGEVANCTNGFGDQDANAAFIIRACNAHEDMLASLTVIKFKFGDDDAPLGVQRSLTLSAAMLRNSGQTALAAELDAIAHAQLIAANKARTAS